MGFELTIEQKQALKVTKEWWNTQNKQVWEISGAAGTGKTTIVYHLIDEIGLKKENVLFMAYVGKATLALARKGNYAQTIHSTIYDVTEVPKTDEFGQEIIKNNRVLTRFGFVKKESLPPNIQLLVVDEAAMVSKEIAADILSFNIPVIALGDRNQLDPVFGEPYFLRYPDVVLTEPMRQSLDSPIIYLSQLAMKGKYIKKQKYGDNCYVIDKSMITDDMLIKSDVVICGRNRTRDIINRHVRENIMKINKEYPISGEKLICRQNNWSKKIDDNIFLINGMVGYVENVYLETYNGRSIAIDFRPDFIDNEYFSRLVVDYKYLVGSYEYKLSSQRSFYNKFEYAYAISVHLSQGSEWNTVLVIDENYGTADFRKKSLYTAITRAKKKLIIAT